MKQTFLSTSQIEILIGIIATALIVFSIPLYAISEPTRLDTAQAVQQSLDLEDAMTLYAENCSVCHGLAGEGIGATPALNNPALRSTDPESLTKTISRGLYGTAMPAWNLEDGGPLSDYQVDQMVDLILFGNWLETRNRVVNLGLAPQVPFTTQPDPGILESVKTLPDGEMLAAGIVLFAEECVACHGADGLGSSLAPALNDPAVRVKTAEELERTIRLGVPGTLMAGWEKSLNDSQIAAALNLITGWESVPAGAIPAPTQPIPVTEESLALGTSLYSTSCSRCHGPEGQGSQRAPALNVRSFLTGTTDPAIQQIVTLGVPGTAMPVWGDRLTDTEIQAVVGFIRSWEPMAPEVATPTRATGPWWQANNIQAGTGPAAVPSTWYQNLAWQSVALITVTIGLAVMLISTAIFSLRHLNQADSHKKPAS